VKSRVSGGLNEASCYSGEFYGGELDIASDAGDQVVINVDDLDVGGCSFLDVGYGSDVVLNVVGPGRRVRLGLSAQLPAHLHVLAPERSVKLQGGDIESPVFVPGIVARSVVVKGYAAQAVDDTAAGCPVR
jgi:hypothetical protein